MTQSVPVYQVQTEPVELETRFYPKSCIAMANNCLLTLPVFDVAELFELAVEAVDQVVPAVGLLRELLGVRVQTFSFGVQLFL